LITAQKQKKTGRVLSSANRWNIFQTQFTWLTWLAAEIYGGMTSRKIS
jgi:hypothetical protein